MPQSASAFSRDANNVPITRNGLIVSKLVTLVGNNNTFNIACFKITGTIELRSLYGIVTTVLGVNHTASAWRINDQTSQIYLTAVGGTDISAAPVGSMIIKNVLVATAVTLKSSSAGAILEPSTVNQDIFSPIMLTQKTAGVETDIEYHYATTDAPTSGAITMYAGFIPVSVDGNLTAL